MAKKNNSTICRITAVNAAAAAALTLALLKQKKDLNEYPKVTINGKIVARHYAIFFESGNDAGLNKNPQVISHTPTVQSECFYDTEFQVVSAGYLYNNEQIIIKEQEEEKEILSKGGTPIWFGVLDSNGKMLYFRAEDIRGYVLPKENQKTLKKAKN